MALYFEDFSVENTLNVLFNESEDFFDLDDLSGEDVLLTCLDYSKTYKTTSGLKRHHKEKHLLPAARSDLSIEKLSLIVEEAAKKLSEDSNFSEKTQKSLASFSISKKEVTVL